MLTDENSDSLQTMVDMKRFTKKFKPCWSLTWAYMSNHERAKLEDIYPWCVPYLLSITWTFSAPVRRSLTWKSRLIVSSKNDGLYPGSSTLLSKALPEEKKFIRDSFCCEHARVRPCCRVLWVKTFKNSQLRSGSSAYDWYCTRRVLAHGNKVFSI